LSTLQNAYRALLGYPRTLLIAVLLLILPVAWFVKDFRFDASADTLVVKDDPKLEIYRRMTEQFGGDAPAPARCSRARPCSAWPTCSSKSR